MAGLSTHCTSGGIPDKLNACGASLHIIGQGAKTALVCPKCDQLDHKGEPMLRPHSTTTGERKT